jgi:hypothetical protein
MVTSSRNPFLSRVGPSVQRGPTPPLESSPATCVCPSVQREPAPPHILFTLLFLQRKLANLCNVDGHFLPPPLSCQERARLCNVDQLLLSTPSRDVSVPACATWAGTSSRPSLPSSSSHPLTHPKDDSSVGKIDSPRDSHRALCPATCAAPDARRLAPRLTSRDPQLAPRLASRDLRRALHPTACVSSDTHDLRHALRPV